MIVRLVTMRFSDEGMRTFPAIFSGSKPKILKMNGCHSVELIADTTSDNQFTTLSVWDSEEDLNAYRETEFFRNTWVRVKALFADKPIAKTYRIIETKD